MIIFSNIFIVLMLGAFCALHFASQLIRGVLSKILGFVNIVLHIAGIFLLLYLEVPIDEAVLLYMLSTFVYTAVVYGGYIASKHREEKGDNGHDL